MYAAFWQKIAKLFTNKFEVSGSLWCVTLAVSLVWGGRKDAGPWN